ncbi:MAG: helix-turn-helix domain-containing protein [Candidatus Dormibacteria bacterium]
MQVSTSSPDPPSWGDGAIRLPRRSGWHVIDRAVRAIVAQLDDQITEEQLGAMLGVSARHLRRMFKDELGISPDELRRRARMRLAVGLLRTTSQTVTDVALAAGFGSVQTFNRTFSRTLGRSPTEVRTGKPSVAAVSNTEWLEVQLPVAQPFAWSTLMRFLESRAVPGVELVSNDVYSRTIREGTRAGIVAIGPVTAERLRLRVHMSRWEELIPVVLAARHLAGLDGAEAASRRLAVDPLLAQVVRDHPGIPVPGAWARFQLLVSAVLGERMMSPAPPAAMTRLVQRLGDPVQGFEHMGLTHLFPTAAVTAEAPLVDCGLTADQADDLRRMARDCAAREQSGVDSQDSVIAEPPPSLGRVGAQYVALRSGNGDAFPWNEPNLRRRIEEVWGGPLSGFQVSELGARWSPWRAYATAVLALSAKPSAPDGTAPRPPR